jgi:hypothetical protein
MDKKRSPIPVAIVEMSAGVFFLNARQSPK